MKSKFEIDTEDIDDEQQMPPDPIKVKFMKGKVDELENEIGKFKSQNHMLIKLTMERDKVSLFNYKYAMQFILIANPCYRSTNHYSHKFVNLKNIKIKKLKILRIINLLN